MFGTYLEDSHYGTRKVVKICSGCFGFKIKPVVENEMAISLTKGEHKLKIDVVTELLIILDTQNFNI